MKENKKRIIITLCLVAAAIIVVIICLRGCNCVTYENTKTDGTETSTEKQALDFTPNDDNKGRIKIPVITGLMLKSNELKQVVDLYNPKENNCYFVISIFLSDSTLIFKSNKIAPNEHLKNITLQQELQRGKYRNCKLVYNCFAMDGKTKLNGSNVVVTIDSY